MNVPFARTRRRRRGMSLVEVMISLAISASLLTAIAAAFTASSKAIEVNDEVFRGTQAARVTMLHLLTEIRNGTIDPNSTAAAMRLITSGTGGVAPDDRTYRFDATTGNLLLITNMVTTDEDYPLARNIDLVNSTFVYDTGNGPNGAPIVERVIVKIAVKVGKNTIKLTGSASPRQYITYQ